SPFLDKKSINFNRGISTESTEELAPSPFIAAETPPSEPRNPYIENHWEKQTLLSEDIPSKTPSHYYPPSPPYAFEHKDEDSSLIHRRFPHKKSSTLSTLNFNHPQPLLYPRAHEEKKQIETKAILPTLETQKRPHFAVESASHFTNDSSTLHVYSFSIEDTFEKPSLSFSYFPEKAHLEPSSSLADGAFHSVQWADVNALCRETSAQQWTPTHQVPPQQNTLEIELPLVEIEAPISIIEFKQKDVTLSQAQRRSFSHAKPHLSSPQQTFEPNPYLEPQQVDKSQQTLAYFPNKEGMESAPIRYSIPSGPTFLLSSEHEFFCFTTAPAFDLFVAEDGIVPPKKAQKFIASHLQLTHPYFSNDAYETLSPRSLSPQLESSCAPPFNSESLAFKAPVEAVPSTPFDFPKGAGDDVLPLIPGDMTFPEGKTQPKKTLLKIEAHTYLSKLYQQEEKANPFSPSSEMTLPSIASQPFELDSQIARLPKPPSFEIDQSIALQLQNETPSFQKPPQKEGSSLDLETAPIPKVREKNIRPRPSFHTENPLFAHLEIKDTLAPNATASPSEEAEIVPELSSSMPHLTLQHQKSKPVEFEKETQAFSFSSFPRPSSIPNKPFEPLKAKTDRLSTLSLPHLSRDESPLLLQTDAARAPKRRELTEKQSIPSRIPTETPQEPLLPSYPIEVPHLAMKDHTPSMVEKSIEHIKMPTTQEEGVKELPLPYLSTKEISPLKQVLIPKQALDHVPTAHVMIDLAKREKQFPNTRGLIEKEQAPSRISSETPLAGRDKEIEEPDIGMIHSQSKEILEDYNQENTASSGMLALANPDLKTGVSQEDFRAVNQSTRFTGSFLTEIPPPSYLETATYAEEFETEVHYSKREDGKGYLFALKMKPKPSLHFSSPYQNIIYVIDGSSSIKKHRFGVFKEGVDRSLAYMKEGDSFNILIADAELTPMSQTPIAWNSRSRQAAKRFLDEKTYRGFFINYDPFDLLEKVTQYLDPEKDNVIIMITDGQHFKTLKNHKEDFQELAQASKGRFSIYTATASNGNNLSMLDLLSTFNNGELMYSKTHTAFSRQLAVMVKHIEHLIANNLRVHTVNPNLKTGIEFYPNQKTLPSLYSDRPYTIYGTIDELKDFDLILQGQCGDQWINIKQHITFKHAEKASNKIKRGFALQQAYVCYDYYLSKDDPFFLTEAERLLNPHAIPTATR
ncbi:MAG: hypothetical protein KDK64_05805, partial [Chlamydiia bacterium]|nr:hypothetical protein [Chlamydiia bacterium]